VRIDVTFRIALFGVSVVGSGYIGGSFTGDISIVSFGVYLGYSQPSLAYHRSEDDGRKTEQQ
jgi:hypothetical protein